LYLNSDRFSQLVDATFPTGTAPHPIIFQYAANTAVTLLDISSDPFNQFAPYTADNYTAPSAAQTDITIQFGGDPTNGALFFDERGNLVNYSYEQALAHELIHALTGHTDGAAATILATQGQNALGYTVQDALDHLSDPNNSLMGPTVEIENEISSQIAGNHFRPGYFNNVVDIGQSRDSRTEDQVVDSVLTLRGFRSKAGSGDVLKVDLHARAETSLIYGSAGREMIVGSSEDDYLYGLNSDDVFFGNNGFDFIHGGDISAPYGTDGQDVVDYRLWNSYDASDADAPQPPHQK